MQRPDETPPPTDDEGKSDVDTDNSPGGLLMSPAELRVIRRLTECVNVLPIIGRAESFIDDKLCAVQASGGVFPPLTVVLSLVPGANRGSTGTTISRPV